MENNPLLQDYAQFDAAETFYTNRDYSSAAAAYALLIKTYPDCVLAARAQMMQGKCYFNLKKFALAAQTFTRLEDAEARYLTGLSWEKAGKWREAYLAYEETDLFYPLSPFGKKARLAIRSLKKAHRKKLPTFKASAAALYKKGMAYFENDDCDMATNIFNRLAREYPQSKYVSQAWLMLGKLELRGNKPAAVSDFKRAAEDSSVAADALYWIAYYKETNDDLDGALKTYADLIKQYPFSSSVPAAVWRTGRIYYWSGDFRNAAAILHQAQLYPAGEETPRCYFFEAKAQERLGNQTAATEIYQKLAKRFDHTYYAYRAMEKLAGTASSFYAYDPFSAEDFSEALTELDDGTSEKLSAIMEIWEETNTELLKTEGGKELRGHLDKYKALLTLSRPDYAAEEARHLIDTTSDMIEDSAQARLGEVMAQAGQYRTPLRFADRKIKTAVIAGKPSAVSKRLWQMAYPLGYWKHVSKKADRFGVDPYFVMAVIREESHFNPKAVSRSSARGLMQIMPSTGKGLAKDLDISRYRTSRLYDPSLNIEMGSFFLSRLLKNFSNNFYLTLAGYNGGPNRIKRYVNNWYNGDIGAIDIDEFVESIPIRETRLYVQKVMGSYFEYKRLYAGTKG
ncbi:MAG: transglycosylase SLT domain-containing protein [Candidatus Margulisiibacteriota bacterium]